MNWSSKWEPPVVPEWAKPQLDKITEEAKEARKWVATITSQANDDVKVLDVKIGDKSVPFEHYKTQQIKLGNKTVSVIVVGDLGLDFCERGEKDEGWNIYHLPTSACFSSAVPPYYFESKAEYIYEKNELLNWMARVQNVDDGCYEFERANMSPINITGRMLKKYWDELRLLTPDTYQDHGDTAKEIIQKWCLSVKVE